MARFMKFFYSYEENIECKISKNCQKQVNGYDCGVHMLRMIEKEIMGYNVFSFNIPMRDLRIMKGLQLIENKLYI